MAGAVVAAAADAVDPEAASGAGVAGVPGVVVALAAGLFACGRFAGGFGPKYFVHPKNTIIDSSDATKMRISGVNLSFFPPLGGRGVIGELLKSVPRVGQQ